MKPMNDITNNQSYVTHRNHINRSFELELKIKTTMKLSMKENQKIKNYGIICLIVLLSNAALYAQDVAPVLIPKPSFHRVEFGFRFMPTVSAFDMKTSSGGTVKGEATFGYGIGGMLAFNFTNHMGIQSELIYNSLSQKYKDEDLDREINVKYLNIPILFSLNTGKANPVNLNFVFGPQLGFNMGSSIKKSGSGSSDTLTYVLATRRSDLGLAYGAGLEFMLNDTRTIRMDLGFRGVYGLININNNQADSESTTYIVDQTKIRTKSGYIGISFLF